MSRLTALSDAALAERCRAGDTEAWNELVDRFSRYVYAIAVRGFRLADEDAEDVFQDVFTRIYTRLDSLRDDGALRPWIAQLTRRACLDSIARRSRDQPTEEMPADEGRDEIAEIDEAFAVREAMATLPDACNDILDRFFAQDQSYRTISAELDLPAGTIASRIARCLRKLREKLES